MSADITFVRCVLQLTYQRYMLKRLQLGNYVLAWKNSSVQIVIIQKTNPTVFCCVLTLRNRKLILLVVDTVEEKVVVEEKEEEEGEIQETIFLPLDNLNMESAMTEIVTAINRKLHLLLETKDTHSGV